MAIWIAALLAGLGAGGLYLQKRRKPQYVSIRIETLEHRRACQSE